MKNARSRFIYKRNGFTLFELIIVILVVGGVVLASMSIFNNQLLGNLESDAQIIGVRLEEAKIRATAAIENSPWGIYFDYTSSTPSYALFPGSSYSVASDTYFLSNLVEFETPASGASTTVLFEKRTGFLSPAVTSTIVIRLKSSPSSTKTITINPQGNINIQ